LPCTTLGLVLQNLIQNAAEAAAAVGRARARLRIAAELLSSDEQRTVRFTVSDDAAGIAAEQLTRLFQKGYSTKPPGTHSGLGLHWCANTLNALGGSITAHSDGRGRETRFDILVPLRPSRAQARQYAT